MKTWVEVINRLQAELVHWYPRQVRDINQDYFLYYLPWTPEHDSGLLIAKTMPVNSGYQLAMTERINKGFTVEGNLHAIINRNILQRLPILDN